MFYCKRFNIYNKMKALQYLLSIGMLAAICLPGFAENPSKESDKKAVTPEERRIEEMKKQHVIVFAGNGEQAHADSVAEAIEMFYVDQFRSFQDPTAPCFMFMSKDAKLALGIGGVVRMRAWADYDGAVPANAFMPSLIPVPKNPLYRKDFKGTPAGCGLFLKMVGRNVLGYNVQAYVFGQFSGYNNIDFKLKKAYFTVNDWTIGYATTTFSDVDAEAPIIDGGGSNGKTSLSAMLIRWLHDFNKHWSMAASLEVPQTYIDADNVNTKSLSPWVPDLAAYLQYGLGHGAHIRLGAMARLLSYRDLLMEKNEDVFGWGAQLSGLINITPMFQFYFTVNGGQGYASHVGDLTVGNYDLVADPGHEGKLYAPWTGTASAGVKYFFSDKVFTSASVGQVRYFARNGVAGTEYKYGRYGNINVYYQPTPRLQAGVEWIIGDRHNFNHEHASAHRFDFMFQFAF